MKFMEENEKAEKETFNLVKETVTVKDVAEICKKHKTPHNRNNCNNRETRQTVKTVNAVKTVSAVEMFYNFTFSLFPCFYISLYINNLSKPQLF